MPAALLHRCRNPAPDITAELWHHFLMVEPCNAMPQKSRLDALLALRSDGRLVVGRDRIAILEAVAKHGSITNAAKALGFSYKAAWDAVAAINNLLPNPAVISRSGGSSGGGALVTEEGLRLIIAFRKLEQKLARITALIAEEGLDTHPDLLFWSVAMKTSARNVFRCTVMELRRAAVNVEVVLRVSDQHAIVAVITNASATEMELEPGRDTVALVKSSFVMLTDADSALRLSTPNRIVGTVSERIDGGINSEIVIDIGSAKTLVAVITRESAERFPISPGLQVCSFFSPSHVILAVD